MLTLSQKLAAGIAATTAVATVALAAPQVQAQTSAPAEPFFGTGLTVQDGGWSATGEARIPAPLTAPLANWTADIFAIDNRNAIFSVSRAGQPGLIPPSVFQTWYSISAPAGGNPINKVSFAVDLVGLGTSGTAEKILFSDSAFTQEVGRITLNLGGAHNNSINIGPISQTLYVQDVFNVTTGVLSSYTNSYQAIPEPMTMLGASAAVAFGAAFKRRQAKKG